MIEDALLFNPLRDVAEVDQFGFVDLAEAYAMNTVPASVGDDNLHYNNVSDPCGCLDAPKDIFDVLHQNETVKHYTPPATEAAE